MAATQEVSSEVKLGEQLEAAMTAAAPVAVGVQGEVVMAAVRVVMMMVESTLMLS